MKISFEIPDDIVKDAFASYGWDIRDITSEAVSESYKERLEDEMAEDARKWRDYIKRISEACSY